jgi:tetratricopeptide (TPR) repeat protein
MRQMPLKGTVMRYLYIPTLLALNLFIASADAMFMLPERAPVDRIIKNAEAYIADHPDDAEGYYVLGRAHYLAWTLKSQMIPVNQWQRDEKDLPNLPADWMARMGQSERMLRYKEAERRVRAAWELGEGEHPAEDKQGEFNGAVNKVVQQLETAGWSPPVPDQATLDAHAEAAIKHHRKSIELDEDNALYHIGLASILEEYAERGGERSLLPDLRPSSMMREAVIQMWHQAALDHYAKAYQLAIPDDRQLDHRPAAGLESLISYNAIEGYTRMAQKLNGEGVDRDLARQMKEDKTKLDNLDMGPITPIILSLEPGRTLSDLLADEQTVVNFDLDGDGHAEKRPWTQPDTALLVWDPTGEGRITSGRQLFGSVTWWLMPGDGYFAMSLLDDNRDGELAGDELPGLALWFDRNTNAVSDPGEVIPIRQTDIVGLKVEALTHNGDTPMHPHGLRLRDGRTLPTWDWIAPAVND